jgi:hypothetical protein
MMIQPKPTTIKEVHDEWEIGWNENPPLGTLEEKYPRGKWRTKRTALGQEIGRRRIIMTALHNAAVERHCQSNDSGDITITNGDIDQLQQEVYVHKNATTEDEKSKARSYAALRSFVDKVLRPKQEGHSVRSLKMSRVRAKGLVNGN